MGFPVAIDFVMRSFRASSGTISAAPLVIRSSWSSSDGNRVISWDEESGIFFKYKDQNTSSGSRTNFTHRKVHRDGNQWKQREIKDAEAHYNFPSLHRRKPRSPS